jgi:hypothetical protein
VLRIKKRDVLDLSKLRNSFQRSGIKRRRSSDENRSVFEGNGGLCERDGKSVEGEAVKEGRDVRNDLRRESSRNARRERRKW